MGAKEEFKDGWYWGVGDRVAHYYRKVYGRQWVYGRAACNTRIERPMHMRPAVDDDARCKKCARSPKSRPS